MSRLLFETGKMMRFLRVFFFFFAPGVCRRPHIHIDASPSPNLRARSHQNNICVFFGLQSVFLAEMRGEREKRKKKKKKVKKNRAQRDVSKAAAAHTQEQPRRREERAARRQHQHPFCSHRSAGNYDNNVFPRRLLSDLVSDHLPFLKSPPDNI